MVVRVARPHDVAAAGALTAEAYLADGLLDGEDAYTGELRDAARRAQEAVLLVAVAPTPAGGEAVVGSLTLAPYGSSYAEIAEPAELELRMLAVAPEVRGRGIAARLMRAALREALARGARRVVLSTLDAMATAQRLYARLGFVPQPDRDWGHENVRLHVFTWTPEAAPGAPVERATWPPLRTVVTQDGWRAGVSNGFTQRANSALPQRSTENLAAAVARVEAVYEGAGLPALIRVDSGGPEALGDLLLARGYEERSLTDVLVRPVGEPAAAVAGIHVSDEPDDAWLCAWLGVKAPLTDLALARAVLEGAPASYLTAVASGQVVGTVRVAVTEGWAALSCLAVDPHARRGGLGRALTDQALRVAAEHGAARAFLQVVDANPAAQTLYAGMGFRLADTYRYLAGR